MRFYPPDAPVPDALRTDEMWLRMLRAGDNPLDYDAVMSSQAELLVKSGGHWPVAGFSLADNLRDLQEHEADHLARRAFTYTVMNPDATRCLGCVYINPLAELLARPTVAEDIKARVPEDAAVVTFWVRSDRLADDLDRRLLAALLGWFRDAWAFQLVVHRADVKETRQHEILREAGLRAWATVPLREEGDAMTLFA